jgi:hypothetical protein
MGEMDSQLFAPPISYATEGTQWFVPAMLWQELDGAAKRGAKIREGIADLSGEGFRARSGSEYDQRDDQGIFDQVLTLFPPQLVQQFEEVLLDSRFHAGCPGLMAARSVWQGKVGNRLFALVGENSSQQLRCFLEFSPAKYRVGGCSPTRRQ